MTKIIACFEIDYNSAPKPNKKTTRGLVWWSMVLLNGGRGYHFIYNYYYKRSPTEMAGICLRILSVFGVRQLTEVTMML